ncbi:MAG: DUF3450 domain-containing protein [Alphaproteobacteria bacterium]|nr:DUF3450 domain-containing protein [Alphaproteobacteria bacterium]
MSENTPSETTGTKPVTIPAEKPSTHSGRGTIATDTSGDGTTSDHEAAQHKNDRPYGYANAAIGVVAALINAFLVGVLMFQTSAVYDQLTLSREALESSNQSFQVTIDEMRQQREAMTAQVDSMRTLTSTLEQILRDQQRARMSFRVKLEQIDDVQTGIRVVFPFEIGGTTEARKVRFKNYLSQGAPGQRQYLDSLKLDWEKRESNPLSDVDPTEVGRRFVTPVLSQTRLKAVVSREESLYLVGRLEYCDIYGRCRYFMRCAEFGHQPGVISYCGTRVGDLGEDGGK